MLIFFEDEFPRVGEIKQDLQLSKLQLGNELSFGEGENLTPHHVIENNTPVFERDAENLSVLENRPKR